MGQAPGPAVLDGLHLARQTAGDRALERELLALFEAQARRLLPALRGEGGRSARAEAAHTLKGAALAIGAGRVAALAGAMEDAADGDGTGPGLAALGPALEEALVAASRAMALRRDDLAA